MSRVSINNDNKIDISKPKEKDIPNTQVQKLEINNEEDILNSKLKIQESIIVSSNKTELLRTSKDKENLVNDLKQSQQNEDLEINVNIDLLNIMDKSLGIKDSKKTVSKKIEKLKTPVSIFRGVFKVLGKINKIENVSTSKINEKLNNTEYLPKNIVKSISDNILPIPNKIKNATNDIVSSENLKVVGGSLSLLEGVTTLAKANNLRVDNNNLKDFMKKLDSKYPNKDIDPIEKIKYEDEKKYLESIVKENQKSRKWALGDTGKSILSFSKILLSKTIGGAISCVTSIYGICNKWSKMNKRQDISKLINNYASNPLKAVLETKQKKLKRLEESLVEIKKKYPTLSVLDDVITPKVVALEEKIAKNKSKINDLEFALKNENKDSDKAKKTIEKYNLSSLDETIIDRFKKSEKLENSKKKFDYASKSGSFVTGVTIVTSLFIASPILPIIGVIGLGISALGGIVSLYKKSAEWIGEKRASSKIKKEISNLVKNYDDNKVKKLENKLVHSSKKNARNIIIETLENPIASKEKKKKLERFLKIVLNINPKNLITKQNEDKLEQKIRNIEIERLDNKLKTYY